ncbi:hypothetical protein HW132_32010 [Brasilonema sp. CT11]|nr:hypothetical protein [Brasilonema sp. CT11]
MLNTSMIPEIEDQKESNYPTEQDDSFTPDEQEVINTLKQRLLAKRRKNESVLKGLEVSFWGITSYSLARFLVITSGSQGVGLAVAACFLINQITNRDCFDGLNINRRDGQWEMDGMGKFIKFGFSTVVSAFVIWSALGNFLQLTEQSKNTYDQLQNKVEEFNRLPDDQQNKWLIIGGLLGLGGVYTIIDGARRK